MYKIVYAESNVLYEATNQIEEEVKKLKSRGWVEQGGVSISHFDTYTSNNDYYTVAQAMVKKD